MTERRERLRRVRAKVKKRIQELPMGKIILALISIAAATLILSLTVGQDLYDQRTPELSSFSIIHFSGYLFFLLMPVELVFIFYLGLYNELLMVGLALVTALFAQFIDYAIGFMLHKHLFRKLSTSPKYERIRQLIGRYGKGTIFIFNLLPLSSPIVAFVAGAIKYRFKQVILWSFYGLAIKYVFLALLF